MKPTPITNRNARQFPIVDYHYHAATLGGSSGRCVERSKSLRDISRDYFDAEANDEFVIEGAVFAALILTAVVPIVSAASAVLELGRAFPF
jgi:hypothetical protein